jgi:hypothetical protein
MNSPLTDAPERPRLSQLDEAYVQSLDEGRLRGLSVRLLEDLKEASARLRFANNVFRLMGPSV